MKKAERRVWRAKMAYMLAAARSMVAFEEHHRAGMRALENLRRLEQYVPRTPCSTCNATGSVVCRACINNDGRHFVPCARCHGHGRFECPACRGSGLA